MEKTNIVNLLRSKASVFTFKEILIASGERSPDALKSRLHYYVKQGELYAIRRGLYAKDKNYDRRELATKIFTPSYISFETCLVDAGIIFQHYDTIFVASYQSKEIVSDGQTYIFRKIKDAVLTNAAGIEQKETYSIACKERAFLDLLYLNTDYYFDNLAPLDGEKIKALLPMYANKKMEQRVHRHLKTLQTT